MAGSPEFLTHMGFSLNMERVDGRQADMPVTEVADAVKLFQTMPWAEEIAAWEKLPEETREEHRPLFQLMDDEGRVLHVTAFPGAGLALAYTYPLPTAQYIFSEDFHDEGYVGVDHFPEGEVEALFGCFFRRDAQEMLALLRAYPVVEREVEG